MDRIKQAVKERNLGYKLNNNHIHIPYYADDVALKADPEDYLQSLLCILKKHLRRIQNGKKIGNEAFLSGM